MSAPARISVAVKPGSRDPGIAIEPAGIVLRVRERAIDGAANEACVRALAEALDVAPSRVELVRGQRGRRKTFAIAGLTEEEALNRVRRAMRMPS